MGDVVLVDMTTELVLGVLEHRCKLFDLTVAFLDESVHPVPRLL